MANCDGSTKYGSYIYIDFNKINRPCSCTLTSSFNGSVLVKSMEVIKKKCNTQVNVENKLIFGCIPERIYKRLDVQINHSVRVQADYFPLSTSGSFYQCIGFIQMFGMLVHVSFFMVIIGFCVVRYENLTDLFPLFLFHVLNKNISYYILYVV